MNPSGPDGAGIVVRGTLQGAGTLRAASLSAAAADVVTVSVLNTSISTTVGGDGSFTLRGLPDGGFTLVFSSGGTELGRLSFTEVKANQEITLTVQVSGSGVVLLEEQRNGIGHGDVEVEGTVDKIVPLSATGDSQFLVNGKTIVARPGTTAVREGDRARNIEDVTEGRRVHVKGTWLPAQNGTQPVLATEIKLQGDAGDVDDSPGGNVKCAAGQKVEVEGPITEKGTSSITVNQQGKGLFACQVSAGTSIRKGNTTYKFSDLQAGWRVHVSGTGLGLAGSTCNVSASEIKVQQN